MMNFISNTKKEVIGNFLKISIHTTHEDGSFDSDFKIFKNMTPHSVNIVKENKTLKIPAGNVIPRVGMELNSAKLVGGTIPIRSYKLTQVSDLPLQEEDIYLIVSRMVAEALPNRTDLVFPDRLVRDQDGNIIGCKGLASL